MKKLIEQFVKFGFVGVICFVIDYGVMILLTELFGVPYLISCTISFSISVVVNYYLSMSYIFTSRDDISKSKEFTIFVVLSVLGVLLTVLFMWMMTDLIGVHYMLSKIVVTGIVMAFNFITRKIFLDAD